MLDSSFWRYPIVETAGYFSVVVLCLVVSMALFEVVTRYKNWEEIKKGNVAVALATGGKILGICNIFRYSIARHSTLSEMIGWGLFGFTLLIIAYFLFEFMTPRFNVDEEIANDNRSVGFISFTISVGLSLRHWGKYCIGVWRDGKISESTNRCLHRIFSSRRLLYDDNLTG